MLFLTIFSGLAFVSILCFHILETRDLYAKTALWKQKAVDDRKVLRLERIKNMILASDMCSLRESLAGVNSALEQTKLELETLKQSIAKNTQKSGGQDVSRKKATKRRA